MPATCPSSLVLGRLRVVFERLLNGEVAGDPLSTLLAHRVGAFVRSLSTAGNLRPLRFPTALAGLWEVQFRTKVPFKGKYTFGL